MLLSVKEDQSDCRPVIIKSTSSDSIGPILMSCIPGYKLRSTLATFEQNNKKVLSRVHTHLQLVQSWRMEWKIACLLVTLLVSSAAGYPLFSLSGSRRLPRGDDNTILQRMRQPFRFYGRNQYYIRVSIMITVQQLLYIYNCVINWCQHSQLCNVARNKIPHVHSPSINACNLEEWSGRLYACWSLCKYNIMQDRKG